VSFDLATQRPPTKIPMVVAILYLASFAFGITTLIGVIVAYLSRAEARDTWAESHLTYLIRTFWIGLLFGFLSGALAWFFIGMPMALATLIWFLVRTIKSLLRANRQDPINSPYTWIW
jgi:uncharacterized membrane protein